MGKVLLQMRHSSGVRGTAVDLDDDGAVLLCILVGFHDEVYGIVGNLYIWYGILWSPAYGTCSKLKWDYLLAKYPILLNTLSPALPESQKDSNVAKIRYIRPIG